MEQLSLAIVRNFNLEKVIKGFFIFGLVVYVLFALVIVRQVGVMNETIEARYNGLIKIVAWLHLFLAMGLVGLAVVVL